jgi:hypothetical protein
VKVVSAHSRFIEAPGACSVLRWFREQGLPMNEHAFDWGWTLHFPGLGELRRNPDGGVDGRRSPVVTIRPPRVRRGILWTVGEARFCPTPLRQFPDLQRLRRSFLQWFAQCPLIYDPHPSGPHQFDYFLEGSARSWGPIRAFPSGLAALQNGQYFVSNDETDGSLRKLCQALALRGMTCADGG